MLCCQLVVMFPQPCATSCNSQWRSSKAKKDSLLATVNLLADPAAPIRGRARDVDPRQSYLTVLNGQTDGCRTEAALGKQPNRSFGAAANAPEPFSSRGRASGAMGALHVRLGNAQDEDFSIRIVWSA
jgi:hypothetical protein